MTHRNDKVNVQKNIRTHTAGAKKLAEGDMTVEIVTRLDKDVLGNSLISIRDSIKRFSGDTKMLVELAQSGEFSKRDPADDRQWRHQ